MDKKTIIALLGVVAVVGSLIVADDNRYAEKINYASFASVPEALPATKVLVMPFTAQAPRGNWQDPRQQYGCEEASLLIAYYGRTGRTFTPEQAEKEIKLMSDYGQQLLGTFYDSSVADTLRLYRAYFGTSDGYIIDDPTIGEIKTAIVRGYPVIAPIDASILTNPYYTVHSPYLHELVIIGYDDEKRQFITHDPGTRFGQELRYDYDTMMRGIRDYHTGHDLPVTEIKKRVLVIGTP